MAARKAYPISRERVHSLIHVITWSMLGRLLGRFIVAMFSYRIYWRNVECDNCGSYLFYFYYDSIIITIFCPIYFIILCTVMWWVRTRVNNAVTCKGLFFSFYQFILTLLALLVQLSALSLLMTILCPPDCGNLGRGSDQLPSSNTAGFNLPKMIDLISCDCISLLFLIIYRIIDSYLCRKIFKMYRLVILVIMSYIYVFLLLYVKADSGIYRHCSLFYEISGQILYPLNVFNPIEVVFQQSVPFIVLLQFLLMIIMEQINLNPFH